MDGQQQTTNAQSPAPAEDATLVMAKELAILFLECGVSMSRRYARAIIAQCPHTVQGRYIRFADAWAWWTSNPGFRPFTHELKKARSEARRAARRSAGQPKIKTPRAA